uniref:Band 7 domain-containing protein n=1 Tax=Chromera velia CCMP2878 TaxID=1169474 RepID=A0A0K6S6Z1_9ALVE|eukprot:Cvel_18019.t1-p1 / transcript=Cvel_18019.t1 / gene=Cvel_18019 / organism=Chromera_velia_CCMP2878 / gene_product=hypothetical protein / transcript_product=hypothetical protein / location=Cvel_scaffold1470:28941-31878(-) / protein_length=311 / sequence_SO=supercontig / SO=protein_coding / is_pseudo=false
MRRSATFVLAACSVAGVHSALLLRPTVTVPNAEAIHSPGLKEGIETHAPPLSFHQQEESEAGWAWPQGGTVGTLSKRVQGGASNEAPGPVAACPRVCESCYENVKGWLNCVLPTDAGKYVSYALGKISNVTSIVANPGINYRLAAAVKVVHSSAEKERNIMVPFRDIQPVHQVQRDTALLKSKKRAEEMRTAVAEGALADAKLTYKILEEDKRLKSFCYVIFEGVGRLLGLLWGLSAEMLDRLQVEVTEFVILPEYKEVVRNALVAAIADYPNIQGEKMPKDEEDNQEEEEEEEEDDDDMYFYPGPFYTSE